jgi:hypothetical protein
MDMLICMQLRVQFDYESAGYCQLTGSVGKGRVRTWFS